jgi:hypothetical protein
MNWKRYQLLIVTGALCALISGALAFWMLKSNSRNVNLEGEIQSLEAEQSSLTSKKIYPSQAGFEALKASQDLMTERRNSFAKTMSTDQIVAPPMMRAQFGDHVKRLVEELQRAAAAAKTGGEKGVVLADPQFGWKSYLEGGLPEAGEIPDLMLRLELVRHLSGILFDSGISELTSIEAVAAPVAPAAGGSPAGLFGAGGAPPAFGAAPGAAAPVIVPEKQIQKERLFDEIKFTIKVRVYEDHLWTLINRFAADPNQIVIRSLKISNQNEQLWPPFLKQERAGPAVAAAAAVRPRAPLNPLEAMLLGAAGAPAAAPEAASDNLPGLADRRRMTTGGELLSVVIELTVYRLKAPIPATQGS